ncbi:MAG: RlmE family RNA methyltransferase [Alphaproteobacteria bacterium]|nr:RlmE family RNA methyltransferase [Alphaproteobacteria bacterium]
MTRPPRPSQKAKNKSKSASKVGKTKLKDNRKRTASSKKWLIRQINDPYVIKAQDEGYRSRAAFKLIEIDAKYHFLKPGITIIDLGAAPGGWTQVAAKKLKVGTRKGTTLGSQIIAVDLQDMAPLKDVTILTADFTNDSTVQMILENLKGGADVLLSDMAAPACGMTDVDHIRIMNLVEAAYEFALLVLKPGGTFVAKVLQGGTEATLLTRLKKSFAKVSHFKPPASRKDSAEIYVVAQGFREK